MEDIWLSLSHNNSNILGAGFKGGARPPPFTPYLEGQGDLVTRLIMRIIGVSIWVIRVINLLTRSP